ncbi:MAG: 3-deoxy-7-phosphoheptulonate synthase [Pseudomonadota bacterium]
MILVLEKGISDGDRERLKSTLRSENCIVKEIHGVGETIIGVVGKISRDVRQFEALPGVAKAIPVSKPYKLVSREMAPESSTIKIGDVEVGGGRLVVIAGPCAIESREGALEIARIVRRHGAVLFRGGAFKPRTSPYSFQGLEEEGLKILAQVREETGLGVVTEITAPSQADLFVKYVDVVQVGARNMQNFELLKCVGRLGLPVLLKRGLSATIQEWLMAAEYILSEGNDKVILCERGIRTFETYTRNTLDLTAVPVIKKLSHLPIIVDPSHATGIRDKVLPMARAAVAAGADGLTIEVHNDPDHALSDGPQSLYPHQFEKLMRELYVIAPVVGKQVDFNYIEKAAMRKKRAGLGVKAPLKVAYHAAPGLSSHKAVVNFFGKDYPAESRKSFREVFEAVDKGEAALGLVPVENTLSGSFHSNFDLLVDYDLKIAGELTLRIVHNLIGAGNHDLSGLRRIYSHPAVFEQCREFLDQHPEWDLISLGDTAASVERIKENNDPSEAAIASQDAAELFDMPILKEGVETNPDNFTRFVIITKGEFLNGPKNKSSLIYSVDDKPGALFETLRIFSDNHINIVKLESRPAHGRPFEYFFYVDLDLDLSDDKNAHVMEGLRLKTKFFKLLGCYSAGNPSA